MIVKVSVANVNGDVVPTLEDFEELYDIRVPINLNHQTAERRERLISETCDSIVRPLVIATGSVPSSGQINWGGGSHDVAWRRYDFGSGDRIWIRVGLVDSEAGLGFRISR